MYNADSIVTTAQKAGVKYIVMVAKHHDGFCMWDSKYTDFDVMSTPFKRDILGEMANACHRSGMKFCIYYSQRDWHHPDYSSATLGKYNQYMRNQISELLTKYAPIDGIFFDADEWNGDSSIWEPEKLFKEIYCNQSKYHHQQPLRSTRRLRDTRTADRRHRHGAHVGVVHDIHGLLELARL
jgi:alpha-L-fucosidase